MPPSGAYRASGPVLLGHAGFQRACFVYRAPEIATLREGVRRQDALAMSE